MTLDRKFAPAALALALVACGLVWWLAERSPNVPFLAGRAGARWIVYPVPANVVAHPAVALGATFRRTFPAGARPGSAVLRVRAFREADVRLNGQRVALRPDTNWKDERTADVRALLAAGDNQLSVEVTNEQGPPALWLVLEGEGGAPLVSSDERWDVSWADAAWRRAVDASDPPRGQRFDPDHRAERLGDAAWPWLLGIAVLAAGLAIALERGAFARFEGRALAVAFAAIAVLWIALFANNAGALPPGTGFDADAHLAYVQYLHEHGAIPLADQGWEMYQPPLYYLLASAVLSVLGLTVPGEAGVIALRWLNLGLALATIAFVALALRLLFPGRLRAQLYGLAVAAFLPVQLYLFHYPTNETLAIALAAAATWTALRVLVSAAPRPRDYASLGAALGAALLAKFSTLLLVPAVAIAWIARRRGTTRTNWTGPALAAAVALAVCGWHYVRVWQHFGTPLVGNWDAAAGFRWWQDPGYRTLADVTRFGRSLVAPLFSGLAGVWDGLWSTTWGDALCGGAAHLAFRPPWSYGLVVAMMVLGLIPIAAFATGLARTVRDWLRAPHATWTLLLGTLALVVLAVVYITLRIPSYAQAKAFYALAALVPAAALAALGFELAAGTHRWRRTLVTALLLTCCLVGYAAHWIVRGAPATRTAQALDPLLDGDNARAVTLLRPLVEREPSNWEARLALVRALRDDQNARDEVTRLLAPGSPSPDIPLRHLELARLLFGAGQVAPALAEAEHATAGDPTDPDAFVMRAVLQVERGDFEGAERSLREALAVDPFDAEVHRLLARLLDKRGNAELAKRHVGWADRLAKP